MKKFLAAVFVMVLVAFALWLARRDDVETTSHEESTPPLRDEFSGASKEEGPGPTSSEPESSPQTLPTGHISTDSLFRWASKSALKDLAAIGWMKTETGAPQEGLDPDEPGFDQKLLEISKNSPQQSGKRLRVQNGIWNGIIDRIDRKEMRAFSVELRQEGEVALASSSWVAWQDHRDRSGKGLDPILTDGFESPFAKDEIFYGALHFPTRAFVSVIEVNLGNGVSNTCKEVLLLPASLSHRDGRNIDGIGGRAYCRVSKESLTAFGQFALQPN
jgi:hypothetical protein